MLVTLPLVTPAVHIAVPSAEFGTGNHNCPKSLQRKKLSSHSFDTRGSFGEMEGSKDCRNFYSCNCGMHSRGRCSSSTEVALDNLLYS
uniref:Uncharacterized protein n=1 Tax=Physcomitrium patens TaxID=3218 RepID=A0A2K1ILY3_PHYPA|nr:hypothetical protein PHYPA_026605 [Physcomitrium patens]